MLFVEIIFWSFLVIASSLLLIALIFFFGKEKDNAAGIMFLFLMAIPLSIALVTDHLSDQHKIDVAKKQAEIKRQAEIDKIKMEQNKKLAEFSDYVCDVGEYWQPLYNSCIDENPPDPSDERSGFDIPTSNGSSPGVHYVDSYTRSDGTSVEGHFRSNPDGITSNNLNP